ncbi:hypothetical protein CFC21_025933 [Triticum aestivum]|uniref:F-box domain-containing protein n=3 Tax=Triticum aestivum TaxID=4565 RepID=A0A9R1EKD1_WHEAT|nr:hypothetical protein CFC21_025933 [Triticum aestivum]
MTEVLLRLPIKSLLRFRAVCRSWAANVSSDEFCTLHAAKADADAASAPPRLLFVAPTAGYNSTAVYSCSPSGPSADVLLTLDDVRGNFVGPVAAQCRGLSLLYDAVPPAYYVLNAATRAVTRLPPCPDAPRSSAGLGFDPRTEEYKVVRLFTQSCYDKQLRDSRLLTKCETYTLGVGGRCGDQWTPAAGGVPSSRAAQAALANADLDKLPPVFVDGFLHWLMLPLVQKTMSTIMSFSITEEAFGWVQPPPFITSRNSHLVELDGHLCMARDLRADSPSILEIWKLLRGSTSGDWSLDYRIDLSAQTTREVLIELEAIRIEPQVVRVLGVTGNDRSGKKIIIGTAQHEVHAWDATSGTTETIFSVEDTNLGYQAESSSLHLCLFKESLAPVHRTNEETSWSSPVGKAVKEILLRLPAKSVTRFKTVCTQWRRLVEGKVFTRSYLETHKKMDKQGAKIMLVGKGTQQAPFRFTPLKKWLSEGSSSSEGARLETKVVCSKPCHGLNLVSTAEEDYLYNPCTGYCYKIPSDPGSSVRTPWERPDDGCAGIQQNSAFSIGNKNIGLGFSPLNQEHIAIIIRYKHKDLRSRNYRLTCSVWQRCSWYQYSISNPPLPVNDMPPAYVAGVFYWMGDPLLGPINEQVIVAFDIARNEYDTIPCPSHIARWCSNGRRHGFVTELQGTLCVVLADSMEDELQIWKQEHDRWDRAYTICLKAWPDYSLVSNVVVPLSIDSKDGRIMLSTGRKVGLYDPIGKTLERLCAVDGMPRCTGKRRELPRASEGLQRPSKRPRSGHNIHGCMESVTGQDILQASSLKKCSNNMSMEKLNAEIPSAIMSAVPLLYEESLTSYPRVLKKRLLD